jgi:cytochrome c oxidase assembly protein subunit 15
LSDQFFEKEPVTFPTAPTHPEAPTTPPWLHVWAIVTVLATLVLLALGAEVTTRGAGMADRNAFSHFNEPLILVRQWQEGSLEESAQGFSVGHYVIEHSHRLAGIVVGLCTMILAAGLWFAGRPRWLRWLGVAALLAVVAQGVLGALRVRFDVAMPQSLRLLHGCSAPLVFGLLVGIAVLTAPRWAHPAVKLGATQ